MDLKVESLALTAKAVEPFDAIIGLESGKMSDAVLYGYGAV